MEFNFEVLGNRIREARLKNGLTQEKLAEQIGVSTVYISHLEVANAIPSLDTFIKLCNTLNITPNFALGNDYDESQEYLRADLESLLADCSTNDLKLFIQIVKDIIQHKKNI